MTVKALPGVGIYHHRVREDGGTDEHITQSPIRRTPTAYIVYCAPCDAVTVISRTNPCEELRNVEAAVATHPVKDVAEVLDPLTNRPRFDHHDPLALAREDGDKRIPAKLPTDHNERRALARSLRVHLDV